MQTIVQLPIGNKAIAVYYPPSQQTEQILSRQQSETPAMSSDLGKPRRLILEALATFHYLTAEQLTRLLYSPTSYTYVHKNLQYLAKNEFIEWILPAKQMLYGRVPYVYTLSRKGRTLAKELGFPVGKRYRSLTESIHKAYPLSHILAVNEFLLKTVLLSKHHPDIVLRQFVHERQLLSSPLKVELPADGGHKTTYLSPDLWLDLGQRRIRRRYCFCVEVNLTPINQRRWRETVRKYLYSLPAYTERFNTDIITVLVSVQSGTDFPIKPLDRLTPEEQEARKREEKSRLQRLRNLLQWTEAEVQEQNQMQDADMFRFSTAPLDQIGYTELYFSPHWHTPFQDLPVSLLDPEGLEERD